MEIADHEIFFYSQSPPFADSRRVCTTVTMKGKYMYVHEVLVNCLVKLAVRFTDCLNMTIAGDCLTGT